MTSSATSSGERLRICRSLMNSQRTSVAPLPEEVDERGLEVGVAGNVVRRALEQQLAVGEDDDAGGVLLRLGDVVRREQHGRPAVGERLDELPQAPALARV